VAARHAAALGATVIGVDPASVMVRVAKLLTRNRRVRYVAGAAESVPVGDGAATVAWSLSTVHHWADIDAGLAEVQRALVPGGRFVVLEKLIRPGATGVASHGWTRRQADAFAGRLAQTGFVDVAVDVHDGRRTTLSVHGTRV
jgi:ubiquinone/menaquinone biosynthesis C-methylase UbiE